MCDTTAAAPPGSASEAPLGSRQRDGRRPTMRDVAARAQVSFKTVSRVVNEEGGVSPLLERRVRQAIEDLDFRPNAGARILRRSDHRTATIGLLLEDVANPFSAAIQRAVEDVAVPRGVFVLSASLDEDAAREQALCKQFGARHVDGLVLAPAGDDQSHLAGELRRGTAIVCVDRAAGNLPVDSVLATNERRRRGGGAAPRGRGPPAHRLPRRPAHDPDRGPAARGLPRRARRPGHRRRPRPGRAGHPGRGRARTGRSPRCCRGRTRRRRSSPPRT